MPVLIPLPIKALRSCQDKESYLGSLGGVVSSFTWIGYCDLFFATVMGFFSLLLKIDAPLYPPVVTDKLGWFLYEKGTGCWE